MPSKLNRRILSKVYHTRMHTFGYTRTFSRLTDKQRPSKEAHRNFEQKCWDRFRIVDYFGGAMSAHKSGHCGQISVWWTIWVKFPTKPNKNGANFRLCLSNGKFPWHKFGLIFKKLFSNFVSGNSEREKRPNLIVSNAPKRERWPQFYHLDPVSITYLWS